jgi:uncharacterized protein YbaR (Trm112 family)
MKIDSWLLEVLACPKCHSPLRADDAASELVCTGADCGLAYPVRDDIPVLLIDEARDPSGGAVVRDTAPGDVGDGDDSTAAADEAGA